MARDDMTRMMTFDASHVPDMMEAELDALLVGGQDKSNEKNGIDEKNDMTEAAKQTEDTEATDPITSSATIAQQYQNGCKFRRVSHACTDF